jgi:hypothetical protein
MHWPSVSIVTGKWGDKTLCLQRTHADLFTSSFTLNRSMKFSDHKAFFLCPVLRERYVLDSNLDDVVITPNTDFVSTCLRFYLLLQCSKTSTKYTITIHTNIKISTWTISVLDKELLPKKTSWHLTWRGRGKVMVFGFVQNFVFGQHKSKNIFLLLRKARNFIPQFNIPL